MAKPPFNCMALIMLTAGCLFLSPPGVCAQDKPADAEEAQPEPAHRVDPVGFREHAAKDMLCELFAIKLKPEAEDGFLDLMPKGTQAVELVNPGFEFTYDDGKKPGNNYWFISFKPGDRHSIAGGGQGKITDPIQGWFADSCAGFESGREKQWKTRPDGSTSYIVANGHPWTLRQTIEGGLKPNTRYTLLVEVYKRNDYKRAEREDLIIKLTDGDDKALKADTADYVINPASPETGFAVSAITLTTSADQQPGDLKIHLGMNAKGSIRVNYDNVRLWAQPLE